MTDHSTLDELEKRFNLSIGTMDFLRSNPKLIIGGADVAAADGSMIDIVDPGTGNTVCKVAEAKTEDVDRAVNAALGAFDSWASMPPGQREQVLLKLADVIEGHAQELAELEALDVGKPIKIAKGEIAFAITCFRYYAGWPTKLYGNVNPAASSTFSYTTREPLGVCAAITAWNYPFLLASWKLGPALASGNTVVLKPSELTPLSSLRLGQLCQAAGMPPGVVNVIPGYGQVAGQRLIEHPGVAKISFTGSNAIGKHIMATASRTLKRVTLELGGKSPIAVFADADLDAAAIACTRGIFNNSGQVCVATSRLFVEQRVLEPLIERIVKRTSALKMGHGLEHGIDYGPLVSEQHRKRVLQYVEAGVTQGARLVSGGTAPDRDGFFVSPTIFTHVSNDMRIAREEIFGPVLSIIPFENMDDLLRMANDTNYGLAAAVWTSDVKRAHLYAKKVRAGTVWINTFGVLDPAGSFGGFKESGIGRELGPYAIEAYTEVKSVYIGIG
jgi:aldehyde dehydrogenase (NAD+)